VSAKKVTVYQSVANNYFAVLSATPSIQLPARSVTTILYSF